jgi:hypothetical protein
LGAIRGCARENLLIRQRDGRPEPSRGGVRSLSRREERTGRGLGRGVSRARSKGAASPRPAPPSADGGEGVL